MSMKVRAILALVSKFRTVLTACRPFMGSGKPSSLVTTLLNRTSMLQGGSMDGK
jgi:hypothetical protein